MFLGAFPYTGRRHNPSILFCGRTMGFKPATHPGVDRYTKAVLTVIAILLAAIAFQPALFPTPASAQQGYPYLYVEPGIVNLRKPDGTRQVRGKVVIDMRNGDIWGFPTDAPVPYPIDMTKTDPPVSAPIYLGRFDFSMIPR